MPSSEVDSTNSGPVEAPEFVNHFNKEFLESILHKKVVKFSTKTGSNPGDNFTSILFAIEVVVQGEREPLHLLVKTYPALEARQKFLNETNLFLKEVRVYQEYVPDLVNFQKKCGLKDRDIVRLAVPPFVAGRAVDYSKETNETEFAFVHQLDNFLVMVDVRKTYGYQMCDKRLGLDFDHTVLAMKELAKMHALGWAYKKTEKLGSLIDKYPYFIEMCFNRADVSVADMVSGNFDLIEDILKGKCTQGSPVQLQILKGMERIRAIGPMEIMCAFITDDGQIDEGKVCQFMDIRNKNRGKYFSDPWVVSCHGDSWMNNMLFKYGGGGGNFENSNSNSKPTEMMFVDLQMYREGCPTTDLAYMLYSSTTYATRKAHLKTLLKIYHDTFLVYCQKLSVAPLANFTFENLLWRFKRAKLFGFITSCLVLPIILTSSDEALQDLDKAKPALENNGHNSQNGNESDKAKDGLSDLFKSLTASAGNNEVLADRMMGIATELVEDGIF